MRSQFYWGLFSSLVVCLGMFAYQLKQSRLPGHDETGGMLSFGLFPFVAIYFIVGVIMLFNKRSESFAKGILVSALILFLFLIALWQGWVKL